MKIKMRWGNHAPVMKKLMDMTTGPILEVGAGLYSTPFIHWNCYSDKREVVSYDNYPEYFSQLKEYETPWHKVFLVKDWDEPTFEGTWSIALLDQAPGIARKESAKKLIDNTDYIVLHDTEARYATDYNFDEIYPLFKYRYDFTDFKNHTTVLSNKHDLSNFKV